MRRAIIAVLLLAGCAVQSEPARLTRRSPCGLNPITVVPAADHPGLMVYGDSIATQWPKLAGAEADAQACRSLRDDPTAVRRIVAAAPAAVWVAIGTNDYGWSRWPAANFGIAYGAMLDRLHEGLPDAAIYAQTPIARKHETPLQFDGLDSYRAAIMAACQSRPWAQCVDGRGIVPLAELPDGIHPGIQGQATYAAFVSQHLAVRERRSRN